MFREMRRKRQAMSDGDTRGVLERGTSGVLALDGDGGYPYAVPISYVYDGSRLYFHSAMAGHKLDSIRRNSKASFCVVDKDQIVPEEYTTYFRSVIAFGTIRILEDEQEARSAIEQLAVKYAPGDTAQGRRAAIDRDWAPLCMLDMTVEHLTGKEAIELMRAKGGSGA